MAEAYAELGELRPEAAASLAIEPRTSGYLRCSLTRDARGERAFLDRARELPGPRPPRYLVSRPLAEPGRGRVALLGRVLRRRAPFDAAVGPRGPRPHQGARRGVSLGMETLDGPVRLRFTQRSAEARELRAAAAAEGRYETALRDVWV